MSDSPVSVIIYHNPVCGTSRNTLGLIRNAGVEPTIVEYLKDTPDRVTLESLIARMGIRPRDLLRQKTVNLCCNRPPQPCPSRPRATHAADYLRRSDQNPGEAVPI
jgi:hypothetical protein